MILVSFRSMKHFFFLVLVVLTSLILSASISDSDDNAIIRKPTGPGTSTGSASELATNIAITFFLGLTMIDYLSYFMLYVYVFLFVVFDSPTIGRSLFTALIVTMFTAIRLLFSPLIVNTIPFPEVPKFPIMFLNISFYLCSATYALLFLSTMGACLYMSIRYGSKGDKIISGIIDPATGQAPMVVIMMPIYNEEPIPLFRAVESAIRSDYPKQRMHLVLGFDDDNESPLYLALLKKLKVLNKEVHESWKQQLGPEANDPSTSLFPPRLELLVEGVRVTICRFPHGGKSATQGKAYQIVNDMYGQDPTQSHHTLMMFIDSDVVLHDNALYNFVASMVAKPKMQAVTGYVTCRTSEEFNMIQFLQDVEYLEGQFFARNLEAMAGSVTCLPGALTVLRLSAMQAVAPKYFIPFDLKKPLHFHRFYLGEDRFMTHLLMEYTNKAHSIGLCCASRCKTDAPDDWGKLVKQRRRWYLGSIINEVNMLATPSFWASLPVLMVLKLVDYAAGSLSWLTFVFIISAAKGTVPTWTLGLFIPALLIKYLLLAINAGVMSRFKVILYFPVFFFAAPIFKLYVTFYSIYAWDTRTWGGPRADAAITEKQAPTPLNKVDEVMKNPYRQNPVSKRVMKQIQMQTQTLNNNLDHKNGYVGGEKGSELRFTAQDDPEALTSPLKAILPFPYRAIVLGGGDYFEGLIYPENLTHFLETNNGSDEEWGSGQSSRALSRSNSQTSLDNLAQGPSYVSIDTKYLYGKYAQANPSASQSSLDLASLNRINNLTRNPGSGRGSAPDSVSNSPKQGPFKDPSSVSSSSFEMGQRPNQNHN